MKSKFSEGDQVWYVDAGNYWDGMPEIKSGTIKVVMQDGKYYGFGAVLAKSASEVFDDLKEAQAKVKEILELKITRAKNNIKELQKFLEEVSTNGEDRKNL